MSESLLCSDADFEDVLQRLLHVVATVPLPTPGHQAAWLAATSAADPVGVFDQAGTAMRRLLDAGTDVEDLRTVVRGVAASTVMEALTALAEDDGALASEFHLAANEGPASRG